MSLRDYVTDYSCTYLIYGCGIHIGKTTVVYELMNLINSDQIYVITSSLEDYENKGFIINDDYAIEELNMWIQNIPVKKILVLDDFLHLTTENGPIKKHLRATISTTRKRQTNMDIIISTHSLGNGKYMRKLANVFIIFTIDEDSEKLIKKISNISKSVLYNISVCIRKNPHSFLIINKQGGWEVLKLED